MRILFLTHEYPNYVPDLLLHGLRKLLGPEVVDYPRKDCLYQGVIGLGVCPQDQLCPGWFPDDGESVDRSDINAKLKSGFFDLVVADQRLAPWQNPFLIDCGTAVVIIDGEDQPARIPAGNWIICRRETDGSDFSIPLPMALPEEVFNIIAGFDCEPKQYSLGFLGSTGDGQRRHLIEKLAHWYPDSLFAATEVPDPDMPSPKGRMGRLDYYRSLQQCRAVISLKGAGNDTFRFWENAACNAVHLVQSIPLFIPDPFVPRRHFVCFDSADDLRRQADSLLETEASCRQMVAEQRYHLYRHHLTSARATYFLDRVNQALGRPGFRPARGPARILAGKQAPQKAIDGSKTTAGKEKDPLYLGLVKGENYGWGVCSEHLIAELAALCKVHVLNEQDGSAFDRHLPGDLFQALTSVDFFPMFPRARGKRNFGYTFFENELTANSMRNALQYDLILAGSTWCRDRLLEKGITNCHVLLQGIDPQAFYPSEKSAARDRFIIFSGGKFELRKGQDLVLRAVKVLMDKYPDVFLVTCWYNLWPESLKLMQYSQHISFRYRDGLSWTELMAATVAENGLDPSRVTIHELVPHHQLRRLYLDTTLGLFPNRCEGGTNLVLMEYMACGRPAIASFASGHRDVVSQENALLLTELRDFLVRAADGSLVGRWQEVDFDQLVERLEYAYLHRDELKTLGRQAARDMAHLTWRHSAEQLLSIISG